MNADNSGKPKETSSLDEVLEDWGAILILIGLGIEIFLAIAFHGHEPWYEQWGLVLATVFIAVGVYLELHFGGNSRTESKARIAEANARADVARRETAQVQAVIAPRVLTPEVREKLKALQGNVAELAVLWVNDAESAMFGWQIATGLRNMGILVTCPMPDPVMVSAGLFALFPDSMNAFERRTLSAILSAAGMLEKNRSWLSRGDINPDLIVIFVGQKLYAPESVAQE